MLLIIWYSRSSDTQRLLWALWSPCLLAIWNALVLYALLILRNNHAGLFLFQKMTFWKPRYDKTGQNIDQNGPWEPGCIVFGQTDKRRVSRLLQHTSDHDNGQVISYGYAILPEKTWNENTLADWSNLVSEATFLGIILTFDVCIHHWHEFVIFK
jgi:hypothetical protein